jgi:hypothetical protein
MPPSFPFTKGSPAFRGIWKGGVRGDFERICLLNYGLLSNITKLYEISFYFRLRQRI